MSLTRDKRNGGEPFYRREFKQEQFLYEETSNLGISNDDESCFTQPYHYFIFTLIGLLFIGCICILTLDLLLPGRATNEARPAKKRRDRPRPIPSPSPAPRCPPCDANCQTTPSWRFNGDDDTAFEHGIFNRPVGRRHNNTPVTPTHLRP